MTINPVHVLMEKHYRCCDCNEEMSAGPTHVEGCPAIRVEELLPGWYFWDETWGYRHGPFPTKAEANAACAKYAEGL